MQQLTTNKTIKNIFGKYGEYTDKETRHSYGAVYDDWIGGMKPKRILCIGVALYGGGCLLSFSEYFEDAIIVGVDVTLEGIQEECWNRPSIKLEQQCAYSRASVDIIGEKYGMFDVIIDDALHDPDHQCAAFSLWSPLLTKEGIFIIEDVWKSHVDNLKERLSQDDQWNISSFDTGRGNGDDVLIRCTRNNVCTGINK